MDAAIYDSVQDALQKHVKELDIIKHSSCVPISKIVWSVWDNIMGPYARFSWKVVETKADSISGFNVQRIVNLEECLSSISSDRQESDIVVHCCGQCGLNRHTCKCNDKEITVAETSSCKQEWSDVVETAFEDSIRASLQDFKELSFSSLDLDVSPVHNDTIPHESIERTARFPSEPLDLSDEQFVAVHSLSSEMCRLHLDSKTLTDFKLLSVPDRKIIIASYVFSARHRDAVCVQSISLLLNASVGWNWFLQYFKLCERWMNLAIQRLKASMSIDSADCLISRLTSELTDFIDLLCSLELFGIHKLTYKVPDTFLASTNLSTNTFLRSCISGHLQTQGTTVVVGSDVKAVNQMLRTLTMFLPKEEHCLCRYAVANNGSSFSPFLKVQGILPKYLSLVNSLGVFSEFPVCYIDMGSRHVAVSSSLPEHKKLQRTAYLQDIERVLGIVPDYPVKLRWTITKFDESLVTKFLTKMDLLSQDCDVIEGFVGQYLLFMSYKSEALLTYVEEATDSAAEMQLLKQEKLRKALDLEKETDFLISLAMADRQKPGLAHLVLSERL